MRTQARTTRPFRAAAGRSAATPFICRVTAPFIRAAGAPFIRRAAALVIAMATASAQAETVAIASAADWSSFAARVTAGEGRLDAKMTADVTLAATSPRVGSEANPFMGTFDGDGHTLTVDWTFTGTDYAAPFAAVGGCTIKDLQVAGTIRSDAKYAAGFVGHAQIGESAITRCRSSVRIVCTGSGEAASGGFVGLLEDRTTCKVTFRDCLFDGSLLGPGVHGCGGFAGAKPYHSYAYYYNCLFAPENVTVSDTSQSATFSRGTGSSYAYDRMDACYYLRAFGKAQGSNASAMSADALVAALGANWAVDNGRVGLALFPDRPDSSPTGFTYQGVLRDAQGLALAQKSHTVEFRLYEQPVGGEALWGRSFPVLLDDAGLFNVALSDVGGAPLSDGTPTNGLAKALAGHVGSPLHLGLTVAGSGAEISPRQKLLAVPVATMALDAVSASGDLTVAGRASAATAKISGTATASSLFTTLDASVNGNLSVGGTLSGLGTFPVGGIVIWRGSVDSIPDGWKLCNGQNGTPDLRDRFVAGAGGEYAVGATGGEKTHTLLESEMPSHRHEWVGDDALAGIEPGASESIRATATRYDADSGGRSGNSRVYGTSHAGGDRPHENRPPYYALCYIMRVK